jgi:hypothetical protein
MRRASSGAIRTARSAPRAPVGRRRGRARARRSAARRDLELGPEIVQAPAQVVDQRGALPDEPLAVIDQQPDALLARRPMTQPTQVGPHRSTAGIGVSRSPTEEPSPASRTSTARPSTLRLRRALMREGSRCRGGSRGGFARRERARAADKTRTSSGADRTPEPRRAASKRRLVQEKEPAATYSPRPLRAKYHRRCGA